MSFAPGTLVRARGREWVVLPESDDAFLVVRPLGGTLQETASIHSTLETVESETFQLLVRSDLGDFVSCRLLRDAGRFGFRSSAVPFVRATGRGTPALSACALAHGAEARPEPPDCTRRNGW